MKNNEALTEVFCEYTDTGLVFRLGEKIVGPLTFQDLEDSDSDLRIASELGVEPKAILAARFRAIQRATTFPEVGEVLSSTVKRDEPTKLIVFSCNLLTQTDEDQVNVGCQSESSAGKSYIVLELSTYFPKKELLIIASASPTAFFHEAGLWDEDRKCYIVDLEKKILIFLDQPHFMLLERLRPLLSHDRKELQYKITDKSERRGLRTKNVIVKGYPTVEFCTGKLNPDEQEKTRLFLLSPSVEEAKIKEALKLIAWRKGQKQEFNHWLISNPKRMWLKERIEAIRNTGICDVFIENPDKILERFLQDHPYLKPRDMRDLPRIIALIKAHALLNCFHREHLDHNRIKANEEDIEAGFQLYRQVSQANERGLSPYIFEIYEKVIKPLIQNNNSGVDRKQVSQEYFNVFHKPISHTTLREEILPTLENAGLISQEPDPLDKRRLLVLYPTVPLAISQQRPAEQNSKKDSGVHICENCGSDSARLHLIRGKGETWLCDHCLENCPEKV